ncbi:hypothetical protein MHC_03675 [Mycoplasma haemocanis str. Illinois]|uniref:Uncharacterized protein n=1 Tax=Mycoplasma haemocanis (strain Illinois) TaxID=1111676 RepID=H6N7H3_MYCHN|nr:hypothetical protein [Mycoplasma haemocanis]AEW45595.1 hypothetical protein MHC_03675 [Mycoplasma haemocanis str. Illinois]
MSKLVVSSLVGIGGAAGIGGGIYWMYGNSKAPSKTEIKTIQSRLEKAGFDILDTNGSSHWSDLKTQYNNAKQTAYKIFGTGNRDITEDELKSLCKDALKKGEDDSSYEKAKRWCVVPVSIAAHISKLGFTPISTEKSGNTQQEKWTELASKYGTGENKIKDVNTLSGSNTWETLRDKCKEIGDKKNYDDDFDSHLLSSQSWCSTKNQ